MKFGMLAALTVFVAGFFVLEAPAQVLVPPTGPVITTSDYSVVQPTRTGLFGRLRNRRTMSSASMTTMAPAPIVQTAGTTPTTAATIVQAGAITTTPANILPAMATTTTTSATTTQPVPLMMPMQNVQQRQGLFARLRARTGR